MTARHPSRESFLNAPLGSLPGYWLDIQCGCGARTLYPCKLLGQTLGTVRVVDALPRLRCIQCRGRPTYVQATDDPARGGGFAEGTQPWTLALAP